VGAVPSRAAAEPGPARQRVAAAPAVAAGRNAPPPPSPPRRRQRSLRRRQSAASCVHGAIWFRASGSRAGQRREPERRVIPVKQPAQGGRSPGQATAATQPSRRRRRGGGESCSAPCQQPHSHAERQWHLRRYHFLIRAGVRHRQISVKTGPIGSGTCRSSGAFSTNTGASGGLASTKALASSPAARASAGRTSRRSSDGASAAREPPACSSPAR
jgi:hypothetical protein